MTSDIADATARTLVSKYSCSEEEHTELVRKLMKTICQMTDKPAECVKRNMKPWNNRCAHDPMKMPISMPGFKLVTKTFRNPVFLASVLSLTATAEDEGILYVLSPFNDDVAAKSTIEIEYRNHRWVLDNWIGLSTNQDRFILGSIGEFKLDVDEDGVDLMDWGPLIDFHDSSKLDAISNKLFANVQYIAAIVNPKTRWTFDLRLPRDTDWPRLLKELKEATE